MAPIETTCAIVNGVLDRSPIIQKFGIKAFKFDYCYASAEEIAALLYLCSGLEFLSIMWHNNGSVIAPDLLRGLDQHAQSLRALRLGCGPARIYHGIGQSSETPVHTLENLTNLNRLDIDDRLLADRTDPWSSGWLPLPRLPPGLQHLDLAVSASPIQLHVVLRRIIPQLDDLACIRVRSPSEHREDVVTLLQRTEIRHGVRFREDKTWLISCCALENSITFDCARTSEKSVADSCREVAAELENKGVMEVVKDYFQTGRLTHRPQSCCRVYKERPLVSTPANDGYS
ncbi:hypothetical protein BST61_g6695 [Cercospora zeina]